jgi:uncharacterized protein YigA (DUF484 family)
MSEALPTDDAEAEFVAAWLRAHPRFLAARPELYGQLHPPARLHGALVHGDRLADHMQARIDAGAAREQGLLRQIEDILAAGRANGAAAARVQRAVLALLASADPHALVPTLGELLGVEAVNLCAERPAPPGFRTLAEGAVAALLGRSEAVLRSPPGEVLSLHGEAAALIGSDALLRLALPGRAALLALGAREPETFQPGQATDLLQFLAAAVSAALCRA